MRTINMNMNVEYEIEYEIELKEPNEENAKYDIHFISINKTMRLYSCRCYVCFVYLSLFMHK